MSYGTYGQFCTRSLWLFLTWFRSVNIWYLITIRLDFFNLKASWVGGRTPSVRGKATHKLGGLCWATLGPSWAGRGFSCLNRLSLNPMNLIIYFLVQWNSFQEDNTNKIQVCRVWLIVNWFFEDHYKKITRLFSSFLVYLQI